MRSDRRIQWRSDVRVQPYRQSQREALVELSVRAWAPVFDSIAAALGPELFREQYPDWRASQSAAVVSACSDILMRILIANVDQHTTGFAALKLHTTDRMGEIYMIAVEPAWQRRGIAAALVKHSKMYFKESGMATAMIETGGDPGHAPARRLYESQGFTAFPSVRYFKKL
jgi:GNAT superfamily N-acetyltransferase